MPTIFERVKRVIVERLGVDEEKVVPEASFTEDLNVDSLDLIDLMMALEEEFSKDGKTLEISDEEAEKITTVGEAVEFIRSKGFQDE